MSKIQKQNILSSKSPSPNLTQKGIKLIQPIQIVLPRYFDFSEQTWRFTIMLCYNSLLACKSSSNENLYETLPINDINFKRYTAINDINFKRYKVKTFV